MSNDFSAFVPKVHFEQIAIKNLVSNQEYQRHLSIKHIQRLIDNFDLYQINPVKVSRRDGLNMVMNGQHTIESVVGVSGSRETPVWCMIYDDLEYEKEAIIFANQQKHVKQLSSYEIFMAQIEAGSDAQIIIKSLVESYGLILSSVHTSGVISAVSCLQKLFDKHGYHVLDRVLRLCVSTWEGSPSSLSANMMNGVAKLVTLYGDSLKDEIFQEKAGALSAREIGRIARDRHAGSLGYAEALLITYNKKIKSGGLQWHKLYGRKMPEPGTLDEEYDTSDIPPPVEV